jgi:hypothetical protein
VRWRELYQYRAAPRVVLLTPWLDPDCRPPSRSAATEEVSVSAYGNVLTGDWGGGAR